MNKSIDLGEIEGSKSPDLSTVCDLIVVVEEIYASAKALVDRMEEVHGSPEFSGVWMLYHVHGGRYDGPSYSDELEKLKEVLKRHE